MSAIQTSFWSRALAIQLKLGLAYSGFPVYAAPAGEVSVDGNSGRH
ncbi:hypothetical protein [Polynucleobacter necessarius]|nr:hypothetical protein [Polynucleobacter necessarius]